MDPVLRLRQALRALLVVSLLCVGLGGAFAVTLWRLRADGGGRDLGGNVALDDPEVRKAAIAEIVSKEISGWDTFPDAEVGRVLQPGLAGIALDAERFKVKSNGEGLREKEFVTPKPADVIRVVLLGDSFVFGTGVNEDDRFGAFLRSYLTEKAVGNKRRIECLHFGIVSWNIVAETAFLRRTLSLVQPDLVIHLIVGNDLEDNPGARGFGRLARFDPLHADRGEPLFHARFPIVFRHRRTGWIGNGFEYESRKRFEDAGSRIARLADLVVRSGGRYLMLDYYASDLPASKKYLAATLKPEQVCYLPSLLDRREDLKADEFHWNRSGHEIVAKALYSVIRERKLLPQLDCADWPEATAVAREWLGKGEEEADGAPGDAPPRRRKIGAAIDFAALDDDTAAQVTGGVVPAEKQPEALAGPYAALVLACGGARRLHVRGHGLNRVELDGTKVEVFVEEEKVGAFEVKGGGPIDLDLAVPETVAPRRFVSVRFVANDFAYCLHDWRQHVVFALARVALTND
jgi:lysophospholipase L1-like esterase